MTPDPEVHPPERLELLNNHELRVMALRAQKRTLDRIPVEEERAMLHRIETRTEAERGEFAYLLKASLKEGVPIGEIREAIGAKNWKTWARIKREYGIQEWNDTEREEAP